MGQIPSLLKPVSLMAACLLFPISGLVGALALLLHLLLQLKWGQPTSLKVLTPTEYQLLVVFCALSLVLGIFTPTPLHHYGGWLAHYGLPLVVIAVLLMRQLNPLLWLKALACGGLLLAFIAGGNYFRGWTFLWQWGQLPWFDQPYLLDMHLMYHFGRARGFALHPNLVGCLLAMNMPLLLAWWKTCANLYGRCLLGGGLLLTLLSLSVTFSRGAWLAAGVAMCLGILSQSKSNSKNMTLIPTVAIMLLWLTGQFPLLWQHLQTLGQMDYHSNLGRLYVWSSGWNMLQAYGWQGIGILHFEQLYPSYALHSEPMAHLHNLYLQILVESGCVSGSILFLLWILLSRHQVAPLEIQPWQQATGLSLLTLLVFSWIDYPLAEGRLLFVTSILLAIWLQWRELIPKPSSQIHPQTDQQG